MRVNDISPIFSERQEAVIAAFRPLRDRSRASDRSSDLVRKLSEVIDPIDEGRRETDRDLPLRFLDA